MADIVRVGQKIFNLAKDQRVCVKKLLRLPEERLAVLEDVLNEVDQNDTDQQNGDISDTAATEEQAMEFRRIREETKESMLALRREMAENLNSLRHEFQRMAKDATNRQKITEVAEEAGDKEKDDEEVVNERPGTSKSDGTNTIDAGRKRKCEPGGAQECNPSCTKQTKTSFRSGNVVIERSSRRTEETKDTPSFSNFIDAARDPRRKRNVIYRITRRPVQRFRYSVAKPSTSQTPLQNSGCPVMGSSSPVPEMSVTRAETSAKPSTSQTPGQRLRYPVAKSITSQTPLQNSGYPAVGSNTPVLKVPATLAEISAKPSTSQTPGQWLRYPVTRPITLQTRLQDSGSLAVGSSSPSPEASVRGAELPANPSTSQTPVPCITSAPMQGNRVAVPINLKPPMKRPIPMLSSQRFNSTEMPDHLTPQVHVSNYMVTGTKNKQNPVKHDQSLPGPSSSQLSGTYHHGTPSIKTQTSMRDTNGNNFRSSNEEAPVRLAAVSAQTSIRREDQDAAEPNNTQRVYVMREDSGNAGSIDAQMLVKQGDCDAARPNNADTSVSQEDRNAAGPSNAQTPIRRENRTVARSSNSQTPVSEKDGNAVSSSQREIDFISDMLSFDQGGFWEGYERLKENIAFQETSGKTIAFPDELLETRMRRLQECYRAQRRLLFLSLRNRNFDYPAGTFKDLPLDKRNELSRTVDDVYNRALKDHQRCLVYGCLFNRMIHNESTKMGIFNFMELFYEKFREETAEMEALDRNIGVNEGEDDTRNEDVGVCKQERRMISITLMAILHHDGILPGEIIDKRIQILLEKPDKENLLCLYKLISLVHNRLEKDNIATYVQQIKSIERTLPPFDIVKPLLEILRYEALGKKEAYHLGST